MISCSQGIRGRLKASRLEFIITAVTSTTSTIRFRYRNELYEVPDADLKAAADQVDNFGDIEDKGQVPVNIYGWC